MKKSLLFLLLLCTITSSSFAQTKATTEDGQDVLLYDDKTWEYETKADTSKTIIGSNPNVFTKSINAKYLLKSKKFNIGLWINTTKWTVNKTVKNASAEYELGHKDGDLYAMVITEKIALSMEALRNAALVNAKAAAPDIKVVKEDYRMVNGLKVFMMQMKGTLQGTKFMYFCYYYSNENGTVQLLTYTTQKLMESKLNLCEELLNGLVELN